MCRKVCLLMVGFIVMTSGFGGAAQAADTLFWEDFYPSSFDPRWSVIETGDQSMRWFLVDSTFGTDNEGGGNNQTVIAFTQIDTTGYRDIFVRGRYRASNIATPFEPQDFFRIQGYDSLPPSLGGVAVIENTTEGQWGGSNQPPKTFIPLEAYFGEYSWDNPDFWVAMEFNTSDSTERLFVEDFIVTGVPIPEPSTFALVAVIGLCAMCRRQAA